MIYFVIPTVEVTDLMMAEVIESDVPNLHTSLDGTLLLLTVAAIPTYVFDAYTQNTYQDIMDLLATSAWKEAE